eukprot:SAG31_NODE_543_length_14248_cov_3.230900_10_plen_71_part_00
MGGGGAVGAVVGLEEGALMLTRQGTDQEGTLHLARLEGDVACVARTLASREGSSRKAAVEGVAVASGLRK